MGTFSKPGDTFTPDSTDTLTNKTLISPVIDTSISGTAFLDEDDMSSNSAIKVASQQSIKTYADNTSGISVFTNIAQPISPSTQTVVQFNIKTYDLAGEYDNTTNYRFTPTTAGKYLSIASIRLENLQAGKLYVLEFLVNGSTRIGRAQTAPISATGSPSLTISAITDMNGTTDYIDVRVFHDDIASRNISTVYNNFETHLLLKS